MFGVSPPLLGYFLGTLQPPLCPARTVMPSKVGDSHKTLWPYCCAPSPALLRNQSLPLLSAVSLLPHLGRPSALFPPGHFVLRASPVMETAINSRVP